MKKALLFLTMAYATIFYGCNKSDNPGWKDCQVEQFGSNTRLLEIDHQPVVIPYLFHKTFEASGRVKLIDSYIYSFTGSFHLTGKVSYAGRKVYVVNTQADDTIMVAWLNEHGRVSAAEEWSGFKPNRNLAKLRTEFTYDANDRLTSCTHRYVTGSPETRTMTIEYDKYGNCIRAGEVSYEYDYRRTAKQQFYFDHETWAVWWGGVHFLEYLGCFPEITNPVNVRVATLVKGIFNGPEDVVAVSLLNHQFDNRGKLISYTYGKSVEPVSYRCK